MNTCFAWANYQLDTNFKAAPCRTTLHAGGPAGARGDAHVYPPTQSVKSRNQRDLKRVSPALPPVWETVGIWL